MVVVIYACWWCQSIAENENMLGMVGSTFLEICGRRKLGVNAAQSKAIVEKGWKSCGGRKKS